MTEIRNGRTGPVMPGRTVLLIVDVQRGIRDRAIAAPDPFFARTMDETVIPNISRLQTAAREADMEIVFTVLQSLTADGRDRSLDYKLTGFHYAPGSAEAEVIEAVKPAPDEIVLPKSSSSLFNSTTFEYVIRNIGLDTIIVTGFQTDQCIDHTIRDGADRGFAMICATDACATKSSARHEAAIDAFKGYCRLAFNDAPTTEIDAAQA